MTRLRSWPAAYPLASRAVVLVLVFLVGPVLLAVLFPWTTDPVAVRRWILGFGPFAPVAFVAVQSLQVLFAPVPGQALALVGGFLFGPVAGGVYSLTGTMVGSFLAFVLVRRLGRPYLVAFVSPGGVADFDAFVHRFGLAGILVLYLVPGLPDDAVCLFTGLTDVRIRTLVVVSGLGRAPSLFLASYVGAGFAAGRFVLAATLGALVVLAWVLGYVYRDRLVARLRALLAETPVGR